MPIKRWAALALALAALPCAAAGSDWLTVYGDPDDNKFDVIQYSPESIKRERYVSVGVRVSRGAERWAYGGGTYRAFVGTAVVDCPNEQVWYSHLDFYGQPLWAGPIIMSRNYKPGEAPLAFKAMNAPVAQFIRAACRSLP